MSHVDFVFVDQIAVGLLVSDGERKRFYGASSGFEEAQAIVSRRLAVHGEIDRHDAC